MKILMVCLGNICLSPLATGILKTECKKRKIDAEIDSAGFEPYHIGEVADERVQSIASEYGIDISDHRARLFRKEDFDYFDAIYVMDKINYHDVIYMARNEEDKKKVKLLLNEVWPGQDKEVPDPYYGGLYIFKEVYQLLQSACISIAKKMGDV